MTKSVFDVLIGTHVNSLYVSEGEHWLKFNTGKGEIFFEAEGDCCSESWFADIVGVESLFGAMILEIEEKELPCVDPERSRQEEDLVYGYTLTTRLGRCDIIFRNSSNGYYGGWCNMHTKSSVTKWKRIEDDWSA